MKYGVSASGLRPAIHVGRLNKKGDTFLDKEDATDMTLAAVGQYVGTHFNGGMTANFPGMGFAVEVRVVPLGLPPGILAIPESPAPERTLAAVPDPEENES